MNNASKEKFKAHLDPITWRGAVFTAYYESSRGVSMMTGFGKNKFSGSLNVVFQARKPVLFCASVNHNGVESKAESKESAEAALEACVDKLSAFLTVLGE